MARSTNANVQSIDALRDVRLSLMAFTERTSAALGELRSKIDRTLAWLEQDRPLYWRDQERRAYDGVASARIAYETCRMRTVGGRHPECIEEKVALQRAKRRLEYCKEQIEVVKRWNIQAHREAEDYRGRSGMMQRSVDEELPKVVAMVTRMVDALEAYAEIQESPTSEPVSLDSSEEPTSDDEVQVTAEPNTDIEPESVPASQTQNPNP